MRYRELLSEQQLDELRMSPGALRKFAASPAAQGIQAGFEAELIFPGLLEGGFYDPEIEPDYDQDERATSIDEVVDFFSNDDWDRGLSRTQANRLYNRLLDELLEWQDQQLEYNFDDREAYDYVYNILRKDYPEDEYIEEWLEGKKLEDTEENRQEAGYAWRDWLEEQTNWCIEKQTTSYEEAREQYDHDHRDDYSEEDFFRENYPRMSDIESAFGLDWPYYYETGDSNATGDFDHEQAAKLANELQKTIGATVRIGGYHSQRRQPGVWYIESDTSLNPDSEEDMPAEIVSPPMPLDQCLVTLEKFFEWANGHDAYANNSTGFHMGVSLPAVGGRVDYLKLALFLGDQHVLQAFGRASNSYTRSAMTKISDAVQRKRIEGGQQIADAMLLMRHGLVQLAAKSLQISPTGYGKYTSINPKDGVYIEFRSAGGSGYFNDIDRLQNTLMRYAQAMYIASRPDLEREEYYKKLYKFLSTIESPWTQTTIDKFAELATGKMTKEQFKQWWAEQKLKQPVAGTVAPSAEDPRKKLAQRIKSTTAPADTEPPIQ